MENANLGEQKTQTVKLKDALNLRTGQPQENLINTTVRMSPKLRDAIKAAADLNKREFALELRTTLEEHYGIVTSSLRLVTVEDLDDAFKAHEELYHTVKASGPLPLPLMSGGQTITPALTPTSIAPARIGRPPKKNKPVKIEVPVLKVLEVLLEGMRASKILTPTVLGQDPRLNISSKKVGMKLNEVGISAKNTRIPPGKSGRFYMPEMLPSVEKAYEKLKKENQGKNKNDTGLESS